MTPSKTNSNGGPRAGVAMPVSRAMVALFLTVFLALGAAQIVAKGADPQRADTRPGTRGTAGSAPARPMTAPVTRPTIQVVNVDGRRSEPLSAERVDALLAVAGKVEQDGRNVWFLAVTHNRGPEYRAVVYFEPDHASPRLRRGSCAVLTDWAPSLPAKRPYIQVSLAREPFSDKLDVPAAELLPFDPPQTEGGKSIAFEEDDLVRLIDAARAVVREQSLPREPMYKVVIQDALLPIYSIYFGVPPEGGTTIDLRRKRGNVGFEKTRDWSGQWVSPH